MLIFPVVTYGCESCAIKKAESWRTEVFWTVLLEKDILKADFRTALILRLRHSPCLQGSFSLWMWGLFVFFFFPTNSIPLPNDTTCYMRVCSGCLGTATDLYLFVPWTQSFNFQGENLALSPTDKTSFSCLSGSFPLLSMKSSSLEWHVCG